MRPEKRRVLVTGGTGYAGRFIVEAMLAAGHGVTVAGRTAPPDGLFSPEVSFRSLDLDRLGGFEPLAAGHDVLVHAAFDHLPGRYRGGEGDDPAGFRRRNLDATASLFTAAKAAGVGRAFFLSSRAVYGPQPRGVRLTEDMPCAPDTLYGAVKLEAEGAIRDLASPRFRPVSLRVTGIYGLAPGGMHKWKSLFREHRAGRPSPARAGTEVHGADLAAAILLLMDRSGNHDGLFNVSDILVDTRDILALVPSNRPLPPPADKDGVNAMNCSRLTAIGWAPGGFERLQRDIARLWAVL